MDQSGERGSGIGGRSSVRDGRGPDEERPTPRVKEDDVCLCTPHPSPSVCQVDRGRVKMTEPRCIVSGPSVRLTGACSRPSRDSVSATVPCLPTPTGPE